MRLALSLLLAISGCKAVDTFVDCDDFGDSDAAVKVEAFLNASAQLEGDATLLAGGVQESCDAMLTDLGVPIPAPQGDELQVQASCGALATEIESIITAAVPAGARLVLTFEPAVCSIDVDAQVECVAECDANVTVDAQVMCTEGRLVGMCSGMCSGECRVEGMVACDAECRGTCDGTCSGTCTGQCTGTCSATNSEGECIGTCDGMCTGTCSAQCTGRCEGTCVADVDGSCMGECAGTCDVEFVAPRCEGDVDVMADAQCEAACESHLNATAECTEPRVEVTVSVPVDFAAQQRLADLIGVLQRNWPAFLAAVERLNATVQATETLIDTLSGLDDAASELGAVAEACVIDAGTEAAAALAIATATVDVTVEVTVSVTVEGGT